VTYIGTIDPVRDGARRVNSGYTVYTVSLILDNRLTLRFRTVVVRVPKWIIRSAAAQVIELVRVIKTSKGNGRNPVANTSRRVIGCLVVHIDAKIDHELVQERQFSFVVTFACPHLHNENKTITEEAGCKTIPSGCSGMLKTGRLSLHLLHPEPGTSGPSLAQSGEAMSDGSMRPSTMIRQGITT